MPPSTDRGVMLVLSNPTDASRIDEFDAWYDLHVTEVLEVPGVIAATRYVLAADQLPGGEPLPRRYLVVYELEGQDLSEVRDAILDTSSSRTHSDLLEMNPLPVTAIYAQLGERVVER